MDLIDLALVLWIYESYGINAAAWSCVIMGILGRFFKQYELEE